jgi:hypothetical protein
MAPAEGTAERIRRDGLRFHVGDLIPQLGVASFLFGVLCSRRRGKPRPHPF